MEKIEDYSFGKPYKDKIPKEEAEKFAVIFGEGSKWLTELIKYCIENDIITFASCKGHPDKVDALARVFETGYLAFSFDDNYDEDDLAYYLASIPSSKKGISARLEFFHEVGRSITLYVHARVKDESEEYFEFILEQLKKYKQMKEEDIPIEVDPEIKRLVDYTFDSFNYFEIFDITQSSYKKYERTDVTLKRLSSCPSNNKTGILHKQFSGYLQGVRKKRLDSFITHHK